MTSGAESNKLNELRAKTDRDLAVFISLRVDAALRVPDHAVADVAKIYDEVRALAALVYDLPTAERRRLEWKLRMLRTFLNDISSHAELKMQTACS